MFGSYKKNTAINYDYIKSSPEDITVAFAGNPNVGKSTLFNAITGMQQHTGNWAGKTVENAKGVTEYNGKKIIIADLPGCYSLYSDTAEETAAASFIKSGIPDIAVTVCDSVTLERGLALFLQIKKLCPKSILCINLIDEAEKRGIKIDIDGLSKKLNSPVIATNAIKKIGVKKLLEQIERLYLSPFPDKKSNSSTELSAEKLYKKYVVNKKGTFTKKDKLFYSVLTGKFTAVPCMIIMLILIFWITLKGANYPSEFLSKVLFGFEDNITDFLLKIHLPQTFVSFLTEGIYRTLCWVTAVMLPPMMIFFPLFTLAEDCGFLPAIAFNMDYPFNKCSACGKQSLTMCMGIGCNAVGVTGTRIIDSPREKMLAVLTNSFMPCNGRFPVLITLITLFFSSKSGTGIISSIYLTLFILLSILITFAVSKILSLTLLKGMPSFFALEMPPFRKPKIGETIIRSVIDRTLIVLGRAVTAAAPCGAILWLCANIYIKDKSVLMHISSFLAPLGSIMGLDGNILLGFIFGFPANEIVLPVTMMSYNGAGALTEISDYAEIGKILTENGWSMLTAICTCIFTLFHWPCATTLKTIYKETGSKKYTALSVFIPAAVGFLLCFALNIIVSAVKTAV